MYVSNSPRETSFCLSVRFAERKFVVIAEFIFLIAQRTNKDGLACIINTPVGNTYQEKYLWGMLMETKRVIRICGKAKDVFNAIAWLLKVKGNKTLGEIIKEA